MYRYRVGYDSSEESGFYEFDHEDRLTEEQLQAHLEAALLEVYCTEARTKHFYFESDISALYCGNLVKAMAARGFIKVEYIATVTLSGWARPLPYNDDSFTDDEQTQGAVERFRAKLKDFLERCPACKEKDWKAIGKCKHCKGQKYILKG